MPNKQVNFEKFLNSAQKNLGSKYIEKKERIYVKTNGGKFEKSLQGIDFALTLLIHQIKNNISDLHIGAFNNVEWSIKYRRNKMIEMLTYDDIKDTLFEVIDYLYADEQVALRDNKKEFYNQFLGSIGEIRFIYDQLQILNQVNEDKLNSDQKEIFNVVSEKKLKTLFVSQINEAFFMLYGFTDKVKNQDSNIVIGYGEDKETAKEYSFRIAGKNQDIGIDGKYFVSIVSRLMMTDFFTLGELGVGDYEKFIREKLLTKKLNIIGGETNSGKSTTILSLLKETYDSLQGKIKIYSVEDPIEKPVNFMLQTQIKSNNGRNVDEEYTFEDSERFFLRGDPDGILVGEIRDRNTAVIATKLALSGHFCYATLHCDSVLSVVPRLGGWGLDMKNNITSLGFVEVTQLVTTFLADEYSDDLSINEKISLGLLKIKDLTKIDYEKFKKYISFQKGELAQEEYDKIDDNLKKLFLFMQGRSYLVNILEYNHTGNLNNLFSLHQYYFKYLKYLSTYFSNRYVDGNDFIGKKDILVRYLRLVNEYGLLNEEYKEKLLNMGEIGKEYYVGLFKDILDIVKEHGEEEDAKFLLENKNIIFNFLSGRYVSTSGGRFVFCFQDFFKLFGDIGYIPFNIKSKGVVPIVEFFDYNEDFKLVLDKNYNQLLYGTKTFTPMFLYGMLVNQLVKKNKNRVIDFFNVISMFSVEYELD